MPHGLHIPGEHDDRDICAMACGELDVIIRRTGSETVLLAAASAVLLQGITAGT